MKRSLLCVLLVLGSLSACKDEPPGKLEPIPRPAGYVEPAKGGAGKQAEPPADPSKVVLRWKLAEGAPMALRLSGSQEGAGLSDLKTVYVLQRPEAGDYILRLAAEGRASAQDQGTFSERGFILDGLGNVDRNLATLLLELPKNAVGVGDTWALGADLVDTEPLGPSFAQKKADRRNTVKLAALAPDGDDQVATLEYDLHESVGGILAPAMRASDEEDHDHGAPPAKGKGKKGKGKAEEKPAEAKNAGEFTAAVTFTGRGEFLVKAGRWRSWTGTLTTKTEGYKPASPDKAVALMPAGTLKLRLTALEAVPAWLEQSAQK
ncbi:MAG: hypothetical protein JXB05_05835 [Myxococcaceae bacterium]|nr:hypothetical protein [Myxococcaceae bacterium]